MVDRKWRLEKQIQGHVNQYGCPRLEVHKRSVRQTSVCRLLREAQTRPVIDKLKFVGHSPNLVGFAFPNYDDLAADLLGNRTKSGIKAGKFLGTARDTLQPHRRFEFCVNPRVTLPSKLMTAN